MKKRNLDYLLLDSQEEIYEEEELTTIINTNLSKKSKESKDTKEPCMKLPVPEESQGSSKKLKISMSLPTHTTEISKASFLGGSYFVPKSLIDEKSIQADLLIEIESQNRKISYKLYDDDDELFFGLPRYYGIQKYGMVPAQNDFTNIKKKPSRNHLKFMGKLCTSPVQQILGVEHVVNFLKNDKKQNGGILQCPCGVTIRIFLFFSNLILIYLGRQNCNGFCDCM
jgi:hypothetical protein